MKNQCPRATKSEVKQRMKITKPNCGPINPKKTKSSAVSVLLNPFTCCVKNNHFDQSFEEPELKQLYQTSSFLQSDVASDVQINKLIQPSQSTSNESNFPSATVPTRSVTQEKLAVGKKRSIVYEIVTYVYDKLLSRQSSTNEFKLIAPTKENKSKRLSFARIKSICKTSNKSILQENEDDCKSMKEMQSTNDGVLVSSFDISKEFHSDRIIPTAQNALISEDKPKQITRTIFKKPPEEQLKEKSAKILQWKSKTKPNKQQEEFIEKCKKVNSTISNSSVGDLQTNVDESLNLSYSSLSSFANSTIPPPAFPPSELRIHVHQEFLKENNEKISNDKRDTHLSKVTVSRSTSYSCIKTNNKTYDCLSRSNNCSWFNEQQLKHLLKVILNEIALEKRNKRPKRSIRKINKKNASTNTLQPKFKISNSTQFSKTGFYGKPFTIYSTVSMKLYQNYKKSRTTTGNLCNATFPTKDVAVSTKHVQNLSTNESAQTKEFLQKLIFDTTKHNDTDCYKNNVTTNDRFSKLEISEFWLIFNLLTVEKNKNNTCDLNVFSNTDSNNKMINVFTDDVMIKPLKCLYIKNDFLSTSEFSENIYLAPNLKKNDKLNSKMAEQDITESNRKVLDDVDIKNIEKSYNDFGNEFLRFKSCDNKHSFEHKFQKHFIKSGKIENKSISSVFAKVIPSIHLSIRHNCEKVEVKDHKKNKDKLIVDEVQNEFCNGQMDSSKLAVIQLPIIILNDSSNAKKVNTSIDTKNEKVSWNLQLHISH